MSASALRRKSAATVSPLDPGLEKLRDIISRFPHRPAPQTVARWVQRGGLPAIRIGRYLYSRPDLVEQWYRERFAPAASRGSDVDHAAVDRELADRGYL